MSHWEEKEEELRNYEEGERNRGGVGGLVSRGDEQCGEGREKAAEADKEGRNWAWLRGVWVGLLSWAG